MSLRPSVMHMSWSLDGLGKGFWWYADRLGEGRCGLIVVVGGRGGEAGVWIIGNRESLLSGCGEFNKQVYLNRMGV